MMLEDDYGMIDGIINNGAKEPTVAAVSYTHLDVYKRQPLLELVRL